MKGLFIPEITAEMFRNGCLESIEALMAECEIYDIDYEPGPHWIPCSERLPEEGQIVLATHLGGLDPSRQVIEHIYSGGKFLLNWEMDMEMLSPTFGQRYMGKVIAWMPLPEPWGGDAE